MPIQTSPSVAIVETDFSQIVPLAATGAGAIVGQFPTGPLLQPVLCTSTTDLQNYFGTPNNDNYKEWFTAWNFLQYSGSLWVTRIQATGVMNAAAKKSGSTSGILLGNQTAYDMSTELSLTTAGEWICKQPGALGNALEVIMIDNGTWATFQADYNKSLSYNVATAAIATDVATITGSGFPFATGDSVTLAGFIGDDAVFNGTHTLASASSGSLTFAITSVDYSAASISTACTVTGNALYMSESRHLYSYLKFGKPTTTTFMSATNAAVMDELTVFVIDKTGAITGVAGRILELWEGLSKVADATNYLGQGIYYATFMNVNSNWCYWASEPSTGTGLAWGNVSSTYSTGVAQQMTTLYVVSMSAGDDGSLTGPEKIAALQNAYSVYSDKEQIPLAYIMTVDYPANVVQYAVDIAETRRDCIVFVSANNSGVPFTAASTVVNDLQTFRSVTLNVNSSYAFLDSGYKYQFDGFNQVYRWIPLNGDTAGLCANLDANYQSWFSPAGFTRGQIKNAVKISTPLNQAARDILYPQQVNAVVSFPTKGTVLFGDRTMQSKQSAFQSYNIRRLFIILKKSIQTAAQYQLFELNTPNTRNNFVGMVKPFLASVKANQGLADFLVVCDGTNNTDATIAAGQFIADIYIKPLYSIQYVVLNFVAVKSSVQFNTLHA